MELKELIAAFGETLGITGFALNADGIAALEADGMIIRIIERAEDRRFALEGLVGGPPPEGRAEFERSLLQLNAVEMASHGFSICLTEGDVYQLGAMAMTDMLSPETFAELIEKFLNELERIRTLLNGFVPVCAEVAKANAADAEESRGAFLDGLMQV